MSELDDIQQLKTQLTELKQAYTQDSAFMNLVTGLGFSNKDKMAAFDVAGVPELDSKKLTALYRSDTFSANIVELLPDAATKKWVEYSHEGEGVQPVQEALDALKSSLNEAWVLARLYGGSAIILGVDDGNIDFSVPVNLHRLQAIRFHTVLSKEKIRPVVWGDNPLLASYNKPILYEVSSTEDVPRRIHASRIIRFDGVRLPAEILRENGGWGDSVLLRPYRSLVAFLGSLATVTTAIQDFEVATMEIADLNQMLNQEKADGVQKVKDRLSLVAWAKNVLGIMIMQAGNEKYSLVGRNFTGIPELLEMLLKVFIGSTDLPPSKLMSVFNSSGLASEDTTQQREWGDFVLSKQEDELRPILTNYLKLIHLSKEGPTSGMIPVGSKLTFNPIFQLNEQEQGKIAGERAKEYEIYIRNGVVSAAEVAEALAKNVPLSSVINLESRLREAQAIQQAPEGQYGI